MKYCKTCSELGVKKTASFNYETLPSLYCSDHKMENMINVKNKTCPICKKIAYFDFPGGKGKFCDIHKEPGMINIKSALCDE